DGRDAHPAATRRGHPRADGGRGRRAAHDRSRAALARLLLTGERRYRRCKEFKLPRNLAVKFADTASSMAHRLLSISGWGVAKGVPAMRSNQRRIFFASLAFLV